MSARVTVGTRITPSQLLEKYPYIKHLNEFRKKRISEIEIEIQMILIDLAFEKRNFLPSNIKTKSFFDGYGKGMDFVVRVL